MPASRPVDERLCIRCRSVTLDDLGASCHGHNDRLCSHVVRYRDELDDSCPLCQLFLTSVTSCGLDNITCIWITAADLTRSRPWAYFPEELTDFAGTKRKKLAASQNAHYFKLSEVTLRYGGVGPGLRDTAQLYVTVDDDPSAEVSQYVCDKAAENAGSESCLAEAREWLGDCLNSHAMCNTALSRRQFSDITESTPLPARVIDVGAAPFFQPRLVETNGKVGRYVALSYCWEPLDADNPRVTLLKGNKAALKRQLVVADLPPTIQDSIDFTRRLGLQYIWIDRLCIVQDDPEDWAFQADLMCNIYEGALVTLVALATESMDQGLYFPRTMPASIRIQCATKERTIGAMNISALRHANALVGDTRKVTLDIELGISRWATRGWTLQEGYLSRRLIYFGRDQLFWECHTTRCDETGYTAGNVGALMSSLRELVDGNWRAASSTWLYTITSPLPNGKVASRTSAFVLEHLRYWKECVGEFQSREFTYPSDKPKALKGIARAIQGSLGWDDATYSFGVFSRAAYFGLLWYPRAKLAKPEQPRAPSWSWMAYDGDLEIPGPNERSPDSNLLRNCSFVADPPIAVGSFAGSLSNESDRAYLKLTGPMVVLSLHSEIHPGAAAADVHEWTQWSSTATSRLLFEHQRRLSGKTKQKFTHFWPPEFIKLAGLNADAPGFKIEEYLANHRNLYTLTDRHGTLCGCVKFDFEKKRLMGSTVSFLVVTQDVDRVTIRMHRRRRVYFLLALQQVTGGDSHPPVYRRVGVAQTVFVQEMGSPLHEWWTMPEVYII